MNNVKKKKPARKKPPLKAGPNKTVFIWIILIIATLLFLRTNFSVEETVVMNDGEFYQILKDKNSARRIESAALKGDRIVARFLNEKKKIYIVTIPEGDKQMVALLRENMGENFAVASTNTLLLTLMGWIVPMLLFFLFFWFIFYRSAQGGPGGGRGILSFGKSRARQMTKGKMKITFKDAAGVDEAKEELQEVIEFLKDPKKFQRLGGKIPKGVLLMGAPGTGKTLLAKAVAGEAAVPFFSISGSDFVEMFVGVGASRVRDLFEQAKKAASTTGKGCIIFIDEIDAVGRQRFAGIGGGHDEREQTLNALLVEMDGFATEAGVILIAATNRPDVLDPALLRPGRFDRQIVINRPDINGREAILKIHVRDIKLAAEANLQAIARQTSGFSGADLANLVNEAALLAARKNKKEVTTEEMDAAIERVVAGPEKKSRVISAHEKDLVAYHESGHALLALLIPGAEPLHKVSTIPRGVALGYTMRLPTEDRYITSRTELEGSIVGLLGGRASEELIFNEVTTGAQSDLGIATDLARRMVCEFGMSEKLGYLTFGRRHGQVFLGRDIAEEKDYSEKTAQLIDEEMHRIIDESYTRAKAELIRHKDKLKALAETLCEKEVLMLKEVRKIVGIEEPKEDTSGGSDAVELSKEVKETTNDGPEAITSKEANAG